MKDLFLSQFSGLVASADRDLATPALMIARLECPSLDPAPYLQRLDDMLEIDIHVISTNAGGAANVRTTAQTANRTTAATARIILNGDDPAFTQVMRADWQSPRRDVPTR